MPSSPVGSNTNPPTHTSQTNSNQPITQEQYQQSLQSYEENVGSLQSRVNGANNNVRNTRREIANLSGGVTGFFSWVSGTSSALQSTLNTDIRYRDQLQSQLTERQRILRRAQEAARSGDYGTARAILQGNEEQHRRQLLAAGRTAVQGLQSANQQLASADQFLARTETTLRVGQRVCVVTAAVAATVMTGGAGAPLLVTALTATAAGTSISAATYLTEAGGHVAQGNLTAGQAFGQAGRQIGSDALMSAQIGLAGGTGFAVGGMRALSSVSVVGRGMIAGGAGGLTGSVFQTATGMALGTDERTWGQRIADTVVQTGIGVATGGMGARGQNILNGMTQQGTNTLLRTVGVRAIHDVAFPVITALGATSLTNYLTGRRPPTLEQAAEQTVIAILGSAIGSHAASNRDQNTPWRQALSQQLTSFPTFSSVRGAFSRLFTRTTPPAPTQSNTPTNQAGTETMVPPRVFSHEELPASVTNSNAYRHATRNGRSVVVLEDASLPATHPARADVVINPDGRRVTILRVRDRSQLNNTTRISHELRHATRRQGIIDPVVRDSQGNVVRRMSETEYLARRSLEEFQVRAGRTPGDAPHGPNVEHVRNLQTLLRNENFEGALQYAQNNGLSNYLSGFRRDYQFNVRRNPAEPLVQRGRDITTHEEAVRLVKETLVEEARNGNIQTLEQLRGLRTEAQALGVDITQLPEYHLVGNNVFRNYFDNNTTLPLNRTLNGRRVTVDTLIQEANALGIQCSRPLPASVTLTNSTGAVVTRPTQVQQQAGTTQVHNQIKTHLESLGYSQTDISNILSNISLQLPSGNGSQTFGYTGANGLRISFRFDPPHNQAGHTNPEQFNYHYNLDITTPTTTHSEVIVVN